MTVRPAAPPRRAIGAASWFKAPAAAAETAMVLLDQVRDEPLIAELQPGERLRWSGRTRHEPLARPRRPGDAPRRPGCGPVRVHLGGDHVTSTISSGGSPFDVFLLLWGLLFAAFGLYLVPGRLIARRYLGRRTAYALTNLRALVIKPTWRAGRQTAFVWLATGPAVSQRTRRDGRGTVMIGATIYQQAAVLAGDPGWFLAKSYERPLVAFWNIADAAEVSRLAARLISEAKTASKPARSPGVRRAADLVHPRGGRASRSSPRAAPSRSSRDCRSS